MPTLSIHGDVHIPDNIIHALGLKPGTEMAFERLGGCPRIRYSNDYLLMRFRKILNYPDTKL
jgi:hypothetical protein